MSLKLRLVVLVLVAMLPAVAIQVSNELTLRREGQFRAQAEALRQAELLAAEQGRLIDGVRRSLLVLTATRALRELEPGPCAALLAEVGRHDAFLKRVSAVDVEGRVVCSGDGSAEPPPSGIHFEAMREEGFVVGRYAEERGVAVLRFAQALRGPDGRIAGAAIAAVDLHLLVGGVGGFGWSIDVPVLIADRDGVVLARYPELPAVVGTSIAQQYPELFASPLPGVREVVGVDGVERIVGFVPPAVGPGGFYIGVGFAKAAALAEVDAATLRGVLLIAAGAALALLLAFFGARRFVSEPLRDLALGLRRLGEGDLTARTGLVAARGELGELGVAFDRVAARLERAMAELREARDRAEQGHEQLAVALASSNAYGWSWDLESGRIERTPHAAEMLGVPPGELAAVPPAAPALAHRDQPAAAMQRFRAELVEAGAAEATLRMPDRGGEARWSFTRARVLQGPDGRRIAHGVTVDVSERQRLVQQKDLLLRELNHRAMNGLAMISSVLSLQRARIADPGEAARFDAAIGRVSALAAVYRRLHARQEVQEVDLAAYLRELCGDLLASVAEEDRIELEVVADARYIAPAEQVGGLGVAVAELLTNAVKHAFPGGRGGRIQIRLESAGADGARLVFRDDGVGLPEGAARSGGLGIMLVRGLAAQIGGAVAIVDREGTEAVFRLPWLTPSA